jgi:meso-butanediol dehydrogenase / (S,S)-butanediol dehydrogenase / diacetyl reductase
MDFAGRVALITGGASGIGAASARRIQAGGGRVAILDLDPHRVRGASEELGGALGIAADVTRSAELDAAVAQVERELGGLDVLVCSAGIHGEASVLDTSPEEWDRIFGVNVRGVYSCAQAAIPHMLDAGGGAIVAIASQHGLVGFARSAAYCASKAAVINLVRCLAIDHGAQGIRANAVCPGPTQTPMLGFLDEDPAARDWLMQQQLNGRFVQPEEVADLAFFLASGAAPSILGTSVVIDGGYIAR